MAFLDFLKKTKGSVPGNDLDVPPPPPLPGTESAFPDFPPLDQAQGMPFPPDNRASQFQEGFPPPPPPPAARAPRQKAQQMGSTDFGAPPFPMPPKMADADLLGQSFEGSDDMKEFDFSMPQMHGLKSREELGLEPKQSEDTAQQQQITPPPRQQFAQEQRPLIQHPEIPATEEIQEEPSDMELEAPPVPMSRPKIRPDFFGKELMQAEYERKKKVAQGPLFVTMEDFREVLEKVDFMKTKLKESNDTVERIMTIETGMGQEFENWRRSIADLQKRFLLVDKKIFDLWE